MLHQILAAFHTGQPSLSLVDLSQRLGVEPAALEGMLHTLVIKGRLFALSDDGSGCQTCPLQRGCSGCASGVKGYMLREDTR